MYGDDRTICDGLSSLLYGFHYCSLTGPEQRSLAPVFGFWEIETRHDVKTFSERGRGGLGAGDPPGKW